MIERIRSQLSSAHLIGVAALLFAVGGGLALASVPKNSVNSAKVKNNTLKGVDVRNNSLTGADVRGLTGADIDEASLDIQLPSPPPSGVQSISTKLGPNQKASISAGGFTISE